MARRLSPGPNAPQPLEAVLIVTPHSSGHVPQDVLARLLGSARADLEARRRLLRRIDLQGDPYTDVLFDVEGTASVHAWASRFVVDLNRQRDAGGANGVVKLTDFNTAPLYPAGSEPSAAEVEERLVRYWDPFHAEVGRALVERGVELLLVGHSMSGTGPALGPDSGALRPAITLMTGGDEVGEPTGERPPSLPPALAREFKALVEAALGPVLAAGESHVPAVVALNRPWNADGISYMHGPVAGVPAFGLEINRLLFMDERTGEADQERVAALRSGMSEFVAAALTATRRHAASGSAG